MKKNSMIVFAAAALSLTMPALTGAAVSEPFRPLISSIYTADPSARVFDGTLYIYPSHDITSGESSNNDGDEYAMEDYHVLSMDSITGECVDHGTALHVSDVPWASKQMWAPDAICKNGRYYLIFPARDKEGLFRLGMAQSDSPTGPFTAEPNFIEGSCSIDPGLLVDDDGSVYCYYGGIWGGQLDKWQDGEFHPERGDLEGSFAPDDPAFGPMMAKFSDDMTSFETEPVEISIINKDGSPVKWKQENRRFFEAPWVHKYNGTYYLTYSTGTTHYLVYATSDSPWGPFTYQGKILEPVLGWTTHASIVEYEDNWYLFYHDSELSGGVNSLRNVKYAPLYYDPNGKILPVAVPK